MVFEVYGEKRIEFWAQVGNCPCARGFFQFNPEGTADAIICEANLRRCTFSFYSTRWKGMILQV